ncbi:hypothetical protein [Anatilimnocola floriformis]|uniref:hypothetical protein n=1 Tax=Anatilimnocola floriformis TaxID=2948575 RepID=UPI0020C2A164|nr:hypothetical protein [Anatilimnocola floriformis]
MEDPLFFVNLLLRYTHILGAITLMGGTIFMRFALLPTLLGMDAEKRAEVHQGVRSRWAMVVGIATGMLLLSGIANLGLASKYTFAVPGGLNYSMLGGIKLVLALPIFTIAALLMGKTNLAKKVQANAAMFMNINLLLAVILVFIGGWLKFADRKPKVKAEVPAAAAQLVLPAGQTSQQPR